MDNATTLTIPRQALHRLEFLAGEYVGTQTLYPPVGKRVSYDAFCTISREACERFVKLEFYADVPNVGIESFTAFLTYSTSQQSYKMWLFSSTSEEPLQMTGDFRGHELVMISEPWPMPWGLQRIRGTFTPRANGSYEYLSEIWEPDGFVKFRSTVFHRVPVTL